MSMLGPFASNPVRPATQLYPTPIPFARNPVVAGELAAPPPDSPLVTSQFFLLTYATPVANAGMDLLNALLTYGVGSYQTEQFIVALQAAQSAADAVRLALRSYNNLLDAWEQNAQAMGGSWVQLNPPPAPSMFPAILPVVNAYLTSLPPAPAPSPSPTPAPVLTTKLDA